MRYLLVLALAAVAYGTVLPTDHLEPRPLTDKIDEYVSDLIDNDGEIELVVDHEDNTVDVAPQFIISWQVRRFIRKLQKQMPCGWPEYGIPPLAPLKKTEATFHFQQGILETIDELFHFRVDGLNDFKIKKLKLNMFTNKITFDFLFYNIKASAEKYDTDTMIDAMRQLGLSVQYEGDGTLDFGLKNLRVAGVLKYKIPILWGSIKITSLKTTVTLEKCESDITGLLGNGPANRMVNDQISSFIESGINENQQEISNMIEQKLVPKVNKMLKGNNFWTLIDMIFSSSEGEAETDPIVTSCVPPEDVWA